MESLNTYTTSLQHWITGLNTSAVWVQLSLIIGAAVFALFVHRVLGRMLSGYLTDREMHGMQRFTLQGARRIAFPLSMLLVVLIGRGIAQSYGLRTEALDLFTPLLLSLAAIRVMVYILRTGFAPGPALKAWEHVISTTVWLVVALHLLGWLPGVLEAIDQLAFQFGKTRVSLLAILKLLLMSSLYIVLALWLAGIIEGRLRVSQYINAGMRVGLSKFLKVFLLALAVLLALDAAGLDLATFAVFGGALGVGLGFGLQKIVSNFISGFILLADRSISPGDVISIGDRFGWVQELRARYIVVRDRDGVETLIPNENLVTSEVINWSYSDRQVRVRIPVQISYEDDPEQAMAIMVAAVEANKRVLRDPPPVCRLMEFADSGIALELRIWLDDPQEGVGSIRSDINLAIWHGFKDAGITIPYPQRDVHLYQESMPSSQT